MEFIFIVGLILLIYSLFVNKNVSYLVKGRSDDGFEIRKDGRSVFVHVTNQEKYDDYIKKMTDKIHLPKNK